MAQQLIERPPEGEWSEPGGSAESEWIATPSEPEITVEVDDGDLCRIRLPTSATGAEIAAVTAAISACTAGEPDADESADQADQSDGSYWSTSARLAATRQRTSDYRPDGVDAWRLAGRASF